MTSACVGLGEKKGLQSAAIRVNIKTYLRERVASWNFVGRNRGAICSRSKEFGDYLCAYMPIKPVITGSNPFESRSSAVEYRNERANLSLLSFAATDRQYMRLENTYSRKGLANDLPRLGLPTTSTFTCLVKEMTDVLTCRH